MATPRYNSGTLVQIPDGFPTQLRNFKKRHSFTMRQMAWKIAADSKGKRISEHALANLMSCGGKKPPQERVGAVLLSNVKKMMREVTEDKHATKASRPDTSSETYRQVAERGGFTGKNNSAKLERLEVEELKSALEEAQQDLWQDQPLTVKECSDVYEKLNEADRVIVSGLITRLVKVDPRKKAVDQLLDLAAKLESDLLNETA